MQISKQIAKLDVVPVYNGILLRNKKEWTLVQCGRLNNGSPRCPDSDP